MATINEIVQASMKQATQKVAQQGQAVSPVVDWALQKAASPQEADFDINALDTLADQLDGGTKVALVHQAVSPEEAEAEKIALAALALDQQQVADEALPLSPIEVAPAALAGTKVASAGALRDAITKTAANPIRWLGKTFGEGAMEAAQPAIKQLDNLTVDVRLPGQEAAEATSGFLARHPVATGAAAAGATGAGGLLAGSQLEQRKDPSQIMGGYLAGVSDEQAKDPNQMRTAFGMGLQRGRQEGYAQALETASGTKQAGLSEALARRFTS